MISESFQRKISEISNFRGKSCPAGKQQILLYLLPVGSRVNWLSLGWVVFLQFMGFGLQCVQSEGFLLFFFNQAGMFDVHDRISVVCFQNGTGSILVHTPDMHQKRNQFRA